VHVPLAIYHSPRRFERGYHHSVVYPRLRRRRHRTPKGRVAPVQSVISRQAIVPHALCNGKPQSSRDMALVDFIPPSADFRRSGSKWWSELDRPRPRRRLSNLTGTGNQMCTYFRFARTGLQYTR